MSQKKIIGENRLRQVLQLVKNKFDLLTKADVGLGNVDNTADADKTVKASQIQKIISDSTSKLVDNTPQWYLDNYQGGEINEVKNINFSADLRSAVGGVRDNDILLKTIISDEFYITQIAIVNVYRGKVWIRVAYNATRWYSWNRIDAFSLNVYGGSMFGSIGFDTLGNDYDAVSITGGEDNRFDVIGEVEDQDDTVTLRLAGTTPSSIPIDLRNNGKCLVISGGGVRFDPKNTAAYRFSGVNSGDDTSLSVTYKDSDADDSSDIQGSNFVFGYGNRTLGKFNNILGKKNEISGGLIDGITMIGRDNEISAGNYSGSSSYGTILAGRSNQLLGLPDGYSPPKATILLGHSNIGKGEINHSIVAGEFNSVLNSRNSTILGRSNNVERLDESLVSGHQNRVSRNRYSIVVGDNNAPVDQIGCVIIGKNHVSSYGEGIAMFGKDGYIGGYGSSASMVVSYMDSDLINSDYARGCTLYGTSNFAFGNGINILGTDSGYPRNVFAIGRYNNSSYGNLFVVGNGTNNNSRSNAFRVDTSGKAYCSGIYTNGADYAEMFEWEDGNPDNEDRRGLFVTFDEYTEKIVLADSCSDYVLGVVSGSPSICGDTYGNAWHRQHEKDEFGGPLMVDLTAPAQYDEEGNETKKESRISLARTGSEYDPEQEYMGRDARSEWAAVGLIGKLVCRDDGTAVVNGYVRPSDGGIATYSEERTRYRVMKRLEEHLIKIMIL